MRTTLIGPADLMWLLTQDDRFGPDVAEFLGLSSPKKSGDAHGDTEADVRRAGELETVSKGERWSAPEVVERPLEPVPFLQPLRSDQRGPKTERPPPSSPPPPARPGRRPQPTPIATAADLDRRLRPALARPRPGAEVDVPRVLALLAEARELERLPRKRRRRYGSDLQVVLDRSSRLVPIWGDQSLLAARLQALLGAEALEFGFVHDTRDVSQPLSHRGPAVHGPPDRGSTLLVLGDLGVLEPGGDAVGAWCRLGAAALANGAVAVALVPMPLERVPLALRSVWRVIPWDPAETPQDADEDRSVARLLRLVSPAPRIEPGLLRAVRLAFDRPVGALAAEIRAWQHPWILSRSSAAATLHPAASSQLRREFAREPLEIQRRALTEIKVWHTPLPPEIWHEAVLCLGPDHPREAFPDPYDRDAAHAFIAAMNRARSEGRGPASGPLADAWLARVVERTPSTVFGFDDFADMIGRLREEDRDFVPDGEVDPKAFTAAWGGEERTLHLAQQGSKLSVSVGGMQAALIGSPLAAIRTTTGHLSIVGLDSDAHVINDGAPAFWEGGRPPSWAEDWGTDAYGAWVAFAVEAKDGSRITQRLRWIPPGRFLMGSPEGEPGRWEAEGPQREVTLGEGFWLFATPVTQALYEAVTGDNPSQFESSDRPVESVDWNRVQVFLERLNELVPGLNLVLPSEAQWEYACRAGTTTATYAGAMPDPEDAGLEAVGEIAWFEDNSGGESQPVARKRPNPWGLYDMLGNVWEWCADHWHQSYDGAPSDGSAWIDDPADNSAPRVFRGGSWNFVARDCRAAYRLGSHPEFRDGYLGFRPARGQGERSDVRGAVPVEAAWRGRSPASQPEPVAAQAVRIRPGSGPQAVALPPAGAFRVRSDQAELTFARLTRPVWASGIGRDWFGLFADIEVDAATQRLRWIPPGRFLMGSPEDEPGRWETEGPQREVTLGEGFWLFATPVTQALWEAVMGDNRSKFKGRDRPVERVDWNAAQVFLGRLNERVSGLNLVLPSEAQWEYACRAGTTTATYAGAVPDLEDAGLEAVGEIAWFEDNSGNESQPVARKRPNPWGLYDMLGNVWEWCADHWHGGYEGAPNDGSAWLDPTAGDRADRVVRGGSWGVEARSCRAAYRGGHHPGVRLDYLGFRPARGQA